MPVTDLVDCAAQQQPNAETVRGHFPHLHPALFESPWTLTKRLHFFFRVVR